MIKTRFAPSPTGYLHVGGLRTALYAYLFARKNNGKFILRIEDTDQARLVQGATENLIKTLQYFDLNFDEGPYIQSERSAIYQEHVRILIEKGTAYRCFCTRERLEEMRDKQVQNKQATMYDRKCLYLSESEIKAHLDQKTPFVIRQKIPYEVIRFKDLIRDNVQFHGKTIDDQVLMKSDNLPTYHLANVVDDHLMGITHVIRGEEWLPSTPKHIALYQAFGWTPPQFAHLPLLLNADKSKLSKRQGDVSVENYIEKGYLKEAILNFVAFLGWHPGAGEEEEIFTLDELKQIFDLKNVHKAGAVFNLEKLDWYSWRWQKRKYEEDPRERSEKLKELCEKYTSDKYKKETQKYQKALLTVEEKILKDPKQTDSYIEFYFHLPAYDKQLLTHEKMGVDLSQARESLTKSAQVLAEIADWNEENLKKTLTALVTAMGIKNGQLFWPLRAALTGLIQSPGVFEVPYVLGKEESLKRISLALAKL
ncbi:glutamate--tRNA ligase [Candidatus Peregrinibacteria bacterium]|nr:glutamate--tRNA ligase [Candidatus Peregrinibacteria bacterium]